MIKEKFKEWLFSEPERRQKYVEYYNETFNNIRLREYDGSHLQFPGMNPAIELKPHQKNAVARILLGGNTLLAHCVGAGKSFEMMAACMEQKRLGLANKTIMVVPKPLIGHPFCSHQIEISAVPPAFSSGFPSVLQSNAPRYAPSSYQSHS